MSVTETFVGFVCQKARQHGVSVVLKCVDAIAYPGTELEVNGYFDYKTPELGVATEPDHWLHTFTHEFSHMEQWAENCDVWRHSIVNGEDVGDVIDEWLEHKRELDPDKVADYIARLRNVELDCERRTVANIRKYNLPIKIGDYIRRANAYIYFYRAIQKHRKWYTQAPYENEKIVAVMPDHFNNNYNDIPTQMEPLFDELLGVLPRFCDLSCEYADWPQEANHGGCFTFDALYCKKHKRLVHKNGKCLG